LIDHLDALFTSLREAKRRFDENNDNGQQGGLHALDAIWRYLLVFPVVHQERLSNPLVALIAALAPATEQPSPPERQAAAPLVPNA
jgi:hypothetical protein